MSLRAALISVLFAGAIGADDGHEDTFGHAQVDIPDGRFAVVGHGQVIDFEGGCAAFKWVRSVVTAQISVFPVM